MPGQKFGGARRKTSKVLLAAVSVAAMVVGVHVLSSVFLGQSPVGKHARTHTHTHTHKCAYTHDHAHTEVSEADGLGSDSGTYACTQTDACVHLYARTLLKPLFHAPVRTCTCT